MAEGRWVTIRGNAVFLEDKENKEDESKHARVPKGKAEGDQFASAARVSAGVESEGYTENSANLTNAKKLLEEWQEEYNEEGPFWPDPGDGKYIVYRDSKGRLLAGATVHKRRTATHIDSIKSQSAGAGLRILNGLKSKNIFITATASSEKSMKWFINNGFRREDNRPGDYNVIWKRGTSR
jgi:hypothetical protein